MLNNTSLYEDIEQLSSISPIQLFSCRLLKGYGVWGNSFAGIDCTEPNTTESRFFDCGLLIDVQNETSYACSACNESLRLDGLGNDTLCSTEFKLNMVTVVFETALKSLWVRLPNFLENSFSFSDVIQCFSNSPYVVNRTLHLDGVVSSLNDSVYENFECYFDYKDSDSVNNNLEYDWSFLLMILFIVAGGVGNILVCLAVCLDKRLHNVTNYFLLSLAIADLLVSLFVMPMGAIPGFLGYWPLGFVWCNIYVTCDVLACSASIMHMCFISVGRYIGIRNPLRSRHTATKRRVMIKIASVWLLSMFISSSITVLGLIDRANIMPTPDLCVINNRFFWIFGSLVAFYFPMVTMVVSFALTVQLLKRQAKLAATPVPGGTQRRYVGKLKITDKNIYRLCGYDGGFRRVGARSSPDLSRQASQRQTWRVTSTSRVQRHKVCITKSQPQLNYMNGGGKSKGGRGQGKDVATQTPDNIAAETRRAKLNPLRLSLAAPNALSLKFLVNRRKPRSMSANAVATEQKATKVLGLVFFTFVLCWAPFFLLNILFAACPTCTVPEHIVEICLWLGYVSSTINPIIYTVFNRTFRAAFLRLLRCHCDRRGRSARFRSTGSTRGASQLAARSALPLAISLRPSAMPPSEENEDETMETVLIEAPRPFSDRY